MLQKSLNFFSTNSTLLSVTRKEGVTYQKPSHVVPFFSPKTEEEKQSSSTITFFVNGERHQVFNPDPDTYLIDYLRSSGLTGTKYGCGEGGCGACTITLSSYNKEKKKVESNAVNSCLFPLCSMDGLSVTTVEGLGSVKDEIHPIQSVIASSHGSQCGFCTPGIVMSIYSSLQNHQNPTVEDIEYDLGGNLCRCTGYRPIFKAIEKMCIEPSKFRKSSFDFPEELKNWETKEIIIEKKNGKWYTPKDLKSYIKLMKQYPDAKCVVGNTEMGIDSRFKGTKFNVIINVANIPELKIKKIEKDGVFIGTSSTFTEIHKFFESEIEKREEYKTRGFKAAIDNIDRFANTPIRNFASLAGNIVTASPTSDMNPIWSSLNAHLVILNTVTNEKRKVLVRNFFKKYRVVDLKKGEFILGMFVPYTKKYEYVKAYKQARRREDDIAIVNSCIRVNFKPLKDGKFEIDDAGIAYGGMSFKTVNAVETEKFLIGNKTFETEKTLNEVFEKLKKDLPLDENAPGGMAKYRKTLTVSFFYKYYLHVLNQLYGGINDESILSSLRGMNNFPHKAIQSFELCDDYPKPVGQSEQHRSADVQATGEAAYTDDIPKYAGELEGALVLSKVPKGKITKIDPSEALKMEGVIDFITSKDIPKGGSNDFALIAHDEKVFYDKEVSAVGQCIGVIVAETRKQAIKASRMVKVEYQEEEPILSIEDAIEKKSFIGANNKISSGNVEKKFEEIKNNQDYFTFEGEVNCGLQEHFYLEPYSCVVVPKENDEMEIIAGTQNPSEGQLVVHEVLGLPEHKIVSKVKRIGGAFGGKESRINTMIPAVATAAYSLGRPVRIVLERDSDINYTGQRAPFLGKYKVAINKKTLKIEACDLVMYGNAGYSLDLSQSIMDRALFLCDNTYHIPDFRVKGFVCKTNICSTTAFRGFGGPQGMFIMENIFDEISQKMKVDQSKIREVNFYKEGQKTHYGQKLDFFNIPELWKQTKEKADYDNRMKKINDFNKKNKFKKRGLYLIPTKFGIAFTAKFLNQAGSLVHIYRDGTVLVNHTGVEMGQGLFTKVSQTVASTLGVPLSKVYNAETSTDKVPNTVPTAASSGSDLNCKAVENACLKLNERLKPYREKLGKNATFKEVITAAFFDRVSLSAQGFYAVPNINFDFKVGDGRPFKYFTYGASCSEVEIDTLTGEYKNIRSDIIMDVGQSINPAIDIGQIEGGFVQGFGYLTMEEMVYGDKNRKWLWKGHKFPEGPGFYKIPTFDDIPSEFNVHLLKKHPNLEAIHRSKAVGEPPFFLGASVFFALKNAIKAARKENGINEDFTLDAPATSEKIRMYCGDKLSKLFDNEGIRYKSFY